MRCIPIMARSHGTSWSILPVIIRPVNCCIHLLKWRRGLRDVSEAFRYEVLSMLKKAGKISRSKPANVLLNRIRTGITKLSSKVQMGGIRGSMIHGLILTICFPFSEYHVRNLNNVLGNCRALKVRKQELCSNLLTILTALSACRSFKTDVQMSALIL